MNLVGALIAVAVKKLEEDGKPFSSNGKETVEARNVVIKAHDMALAEFDPALEEEFVRTFMTPEKYDRVLATEVHHYAMLKETLKHKLVETYWYFKEDIRHTRKIIAFSTDCISMINIMARDECLYACLHFRSSDLENLLPMDLLNVMKALKEIADEQGLTRLDLMVSFSSLHRYVTDAGR